VYRLAALVAAAVLAGTLGYMWVEGWNALDSLYMTVITLATIGFLEVHPLGPGGRIFTILLILSGLTALAFLAGAVTEYVVTATQLGFFRRRRMDARIAKLSGHYIVCGFGRVGEQVARDLERRGIPMVVVEENDAVRQRLEDSDLPFVIGDATDEAVLHRAGIGRAKGLVASTGSDVANIVVTLTARAVNGKLVLVSRADHDASEPKLLRAGATHVVSPYRIAGLRIATQLLNPRVSAFLEAVMHSDELELLLEDVPVTGGSALDGQTLADAAARAGGGVNILAVSGQDGGRLVTPPPADYRFRGGDVLIALGTRVQLDRLNGLAGRA
jgi:voltage-gated potassium channel